ncbi:hypothetical protein ACFL2R_02780 [Patescibacteria group bacterium]
MNFFGLFRSRKVNHVKQLRNDTLDKVFPDGDLQFNREVSDICNLVDKRYSKEDIGKMYVHMACLFYIATNRSKERIVGSSMIKMGQSISKEDTEEIYQYIKTKFLKQQLEIEDKGDNQYEIPGGYGDYGYSSNNPIPTKGVKESNLYLDNLLLENGNNIKWERTGSLLVDNIENMIDEYDIFKITGEHIVAIYISSYQRRNSMKAPKGFRLV